MHQDTVFHNESLVIAMLRKYLHNRWIDLDDEDFILYCVNAIGDFPVDKVHIIKSIIQNTYPVQWNRINKLIILK